MKRTLIALALAASLGALAGVAVGPPCPFTLDAQSQDELVAFEPRLAAKLEGTWGGRWNPAYHLISRQLAETRAAIESTRR